MLASYGTGAIMAVPAHDQRDFDFATQFGLPIVEVVSGGEKDDEGNLIAAYTGEGTYVNSHYGGGQRVSIKPFELNGMDSIADAKEKTMAWLEKQGVGRRETTYRLRDWIFARQRYWGEPFPIGWVDGEPHAIPDAELPVELPPMDDFKPSGTYEGPLSKATDWLDTTIDGQPARRDTNTMPQWAGSSWYYLRYIDPHNDKQLVDPEKEKYWMPVDLYVGGTEHAVLHLLYARFWHKVLFDIGVVSTPEPFGRLVHQGMILGENDEKMSKSRGNVVNPDDVVRDYGADSLRLYEMFMGPLEQTKPWNMRGVDGVHRFLNRAWRLLTDDEGEISVSDTEPTADELRTLHQCIQKVTDDIDGMRFNTAISAMMEFVNAANKWDSVPHGVAQPFVLLLSPFAPHIAEELWRMLGHDESLAYADWPELDESLLVEDSITLAVQINGKARATIDVAPDASKEVVMEAAKAEENIQRHLEGQTIRKEIYVPGRIVNIVAN